MNLVRLITICLIASTILSAHARMYQWIDPDSKVTRFSGKPPVWYRSTDGGPRVFVFENNRIIDDTHISVTDVERDRLRQEAFLRAEKDRDVAKEKLLQAKRLQAVSEQKGGDQKSASSDIQESAESAEKTAQAQQATVPVTEDAVVNEMRMLIQEWEKQRSESARALLGQGTSPR